MDGKYEKNKVVKGKKNKTKGYGGVIRVDRVMRTGSILMQGNYLDNEASHGSIGNIQRLFKGSMLEFYPMSIKPEKKYNKRLFILTSSDWCKNTKSWPDVKTKGCL